MGEPTLLNMNLFDDDTINPMAAFKDEDLEQLSDNDRRAMERQRLQAIDTTFRGYKTALVRSVREEAQKQLACRHRVEVHLLFVEQTLFQWRIGRLKLWKQWRSTKQRERDCLDTYWARQQEQWDVDDSWADVMEEDTHLAAYTTYRLERLARNELQRKTVEKQRDLAGFARFLYEGDILTARSTSQRQFNFFEQERLSQLGLLDLLPDVPWNEEFIGPQRVLREQVLTMQAQRKRAEKSLEGVRRLLEVTQHLAKDIIEELDTVVRDRKREAERRGKSYEILWI
ncbi:MAG: hypothetical protein M1833_006065 [Piccolia ochrophora]|nr:MAG: hypothetical protein M1833_006065 [Piccolia ochrophora]